MPELPGPPTAGQGGSGRPPGQVRQAALWSGASSFVLRLANFSIAAVVAHLVSPHDFGVFAIALTVHAVLFNIGELGVSAGLARGDQDPDRIAPTITTISLTSGVVLASAMALFARPIASALGSADAAASLRVLALTVLMVGIFATPGAQLVRDFRQKQLFFAEVAGFLPGNVLLLILAASGGGALALAWSRVLGQLVTGLVIMCLVSRRYRPGFDARAMRGLLTFGLPLAGANLIGYTLLNADYAVVGHLRGAVDLGVYVLAFNVASWPTGLLGSMVNGVALPALSRLKGDSMRLERAVWSGTRSIALVAFPLSALTCGLADPIVRSVYGGRWSAAAPVMSLLAVYGAIVVLSLLLSNLLSGVGRTHVLLLVQCVWLFALVPAMVLGVKLFGIVGAAAAHVVVIVFVVVPLYVIGLRRIGVLVVRPLLAATARPALAASCSGAAAYAVTLPLTGPWIELGVGLVAGGLVYGVLVVPVLLPDLERRVEVHPDGPASRVLAVLVRGVHRLYRHAATVDPLDTATDRLEPDRA